jgi:hypothetical protein
VPGQRHSARRLHPSPLPLCGGGVGQGSGLWDRGCGIRGSHVLLVCVLERRWSVFGDVVGASVFQPRACLSTWPWHLPHKVTPQPTS